MTSGAYAPGDIHIVREKRKGERERRVYLIEKVSTPMLSSKNLIL